MDAIAILTDDRVAKLGEYLGKGLAKRPACDLAGIPWAAFESVYAKGQDDMRLFVMDTPEAVFASNVDKAVSRFKLDNLTKIGETPTWQASAWLLERTCPEEFAMRQPEQSPMTPVQINMSIPAVKPAIEIQPAKVVASSND